MKNPPGYNLNCANCKFVTSLKKKKIYLNYLISKTVAGSNRIWNQLSLTSR